MTHVKTYQFNTSNFPRHIGFDRWVDYFDLLEKPEIKATTYPPHNIIKTSEYNYTLELAIAGFKRSDIDITLEKNKLTIVGEIKEKVEPEYVYHGIANRTFTKSFVLMDTIVVDGASLEDGILKVYLKNCIPETDKPRKITINKEEPKLLVD